MQTYISWAGFLGAWLLVAGPIYQAALELGEEDAQRSSIEAVASSAEKDTPISAWWWLVPPVHYVLQRRRSRLFREQVMNSLTAEQMEGLVAYINKASGWLYVGLGGFLIAVKETWELTEHEEWALPIFWLLVVAMPALCIANLVARMGRRRALIKRDESESADAR